MRDLLTARERMEPHRYTPLDNLKFVGLCVGGAILMGVALGLIFLSLMILTEPLR